MIAPRVANGCTLRYVVRCTASYAFVARLRFSAVSLEVMMAAVVYWRLLKNTTGSNYFDRREQFLAISLAPVF